MTVDERDVREVCTDAVFERGRGYREDGRIRRIDRFESSVTAVVRGSRPYDVELDVDVEGFDPACSCPYGGPGECKHVVAVLLELAAGLPDDDADRVDPLLEAAPATDVRAFLRDELARNPELRDRFLARFGDPPGRAVADYRGTVDDLFEAHTRERPLVTGAIDFSPLTDLAETHRDEGHYAEAARIYRALAAGIEGNYELVDAAHDHYARTFAAALDGYVECVVATDREERSRAVEFLSRQAGERYGRFREQYERALEDLDGSQAGSG